MQASHRFPRFTKETLFRPQFGECSVGDVTNHLMMSLLPSCCYFSLLSQQVLVFLQCDWPTIFKLCIGKTIVHQNHHDIDIHFFFSAFWHLHNSGSSIHAVLGGTPWQLVDRGSRSSSRFNSRAEQYIMAFRMRLDL